MDFSERPRQSTSKKKLNSLDTDAKYLCQVVEMSQQQQKTLASSIHVCVNSGHIYLSRSISFAKAPEESRVAVSTTKANYRVMPASFFFLKAAPYSDIPYRMTEKRPRQPENRSG